jgi:hypothetical protein
MSARDSVLEERIKKLEQDKLESDRKIIELNKKVDDLHNVINIVLNRNIQIENSNDDVCEDPNDNPS